MIICVSICQGRIDLIQQLDFGLQHLTTFCAGKENREFTVYQF